MAFVIFLNMTFKVSSKVSLSMIERGSLPQVPNETLGLSSVSQTLSSSFNRLRRGITNRIGKHTSQPQDQTSKEINVEQLSPTSLRTHLTAYQATVRNLTCAKRS